MQDIVKAMLNCPKPVCVWIGPSGSRAASAGVFITMAADFSAMAPATNIGAAHPVQMGMGQSGSGKEKDEMMQKIVNDAVAYIQSIAKERGRPLDWVKNAVVKSASIGAEEAHQKGIVDFISPDINDFMKKIDGKEIIKNGVKIKIETKNITLDYKDLSVWRDFLHKIANPNLAFIFLIIGVWGIIHETATPGVGFGGAAGGISLLLAFFSLRILPINLTGLLLIILGAILLFLEIFTPSFGVLTVGGIVSFVLGGMMLIDKTRMDIGVSLGTILPTVAFLAFFMIFIVGAIIKSQRKKVTTGEKGIIGETGIAQEDISGEGLVFVHGELWRARSSEEIKKGARVTVKEVKGNTLVVQKEIK